MRRQLWPISPIRLARQPGMIFTPGGGAAPGCHCEGCTCHNCPDGCCDEISVIISGIVYNSSSCGPDIEWFNQTFVLVKEHTWIVESSGLPACVWHYDLPEVKCGIYAVVSWMTGGSDNYVGLSNVPYDPTLPIYGVGSPPYAMSYTNLWGNQDPQPWQEGCLPYDGERSVIGYYGFGTVLPLLDDGANSTAQIVC